MRRSRKGAWQSVVEGVLRVRSSVLLADETTCD